MMSARLLLLCVCLSLGLSLGYVWADDFDSRKQAVQQRADAVQELKRQGVCREGLSGLLEAVRPGLEPSQQAVMDAENADRIRLFELIAQRARTAPEEVARAFARRAAAATAVGEMSAPPIAATSPAWPAPNPPDPVPAPSSAPVQATPLGPTAESEAPLDNGRSARLPLKVLTKPHANLYATPVGAAPTVRENLPAFAAYYVYRKMPGWYQVGADNHGKLLGWVRVDDVVEWKQNLVVEFTHPEGRKPVLMFGEKTALDDLVAASQAIRAPRVQRLYETIDQATSRARPLPPGFPVRTMEPARSVKSRDQFYLLPIVGFEETKIDGFDGRILQLAAATSQRGAVVLDDEAARKQLRQGTDLSSAAARGVKVDLVFVMDLTKSMGPFADRTLEMIKTCLRRLDVNKQAIDAIRFGFWGYRDFPECCPGIEFNTHNYTKSLQTLDEFARTLKAVQETKVDSIDYEEDVLAGVADAITQTQWRPGALRQLILVGDAPGRGPQESDPHCTVSSRPIGTKSGMNAESVRHLADEANIYVSALYLKAPKWAQYADIGERQFRTLSRNPNDPQGRGNYRMLDARDTAVYGDTAQSLADGIIDATLAAQGQGRPLSDTHTPSGTADHAPVDTTEEAKAAGRDLASNMFRGAIVEWLGKQDPATVPRDVTVWASDKDLIDPAIQPLEVKVFLTKNELSSLYDMVDKVLDAAAHQQITGEDFFEALKAVVAATASNPDQIRNAETLAKTGLVPEFLKGLPYTSTIMDMNNDAWRQLNADKQDRFQRQIESKLHFYKLIHDDPEKWQALNEGDDRDNWVAAIPIEELP